MPEYFSPLISYSDQIGSFLNQVDFMKSLENLGSIMSYPSLTSLCLITNADVFSVKNAEGTNVRVIVRDKRRSSPDKQGR